MDWNGQGGNRVIVWIPIGHSKTLNIIIELVTLVHPYIFVISRMFFDPYNITQLLIWLQNHAKDKYFSQEGSQLRIICIYNI